MNWNPLRKKQTVEQQVAEQVSLEVNKALEGLQNANTPEDLRGIRERISAAISGGYDQADTLHNIYLDFGYPENLSFFHFWNMYRRFGIAKNIVELPIDMTWIDAPEIESDDKSFDKDVDILVKDLKMWQRLKGLDTRQRVGRYAGLFMRVRDGKKPDQPIESKLSGINTLVQMIPLYESQLRVNEIDNDPTSENYGLPKMYEFNGGTVGNRDEKNNQAFSIHPDRIIIAAEGADNGDIYGIPALEAAYNSLMDLRKIIGSGGEGFYKNAAASIVFKLTDASSAKDNATLLSKFNDNADDFMRNRARRSLWTPGMDAETLDTNLVQPKDFFMNALNDVAAASKIPATVLIGQQTGKLASTEDSKNFLSGINSRRTNFVSEMVGSVINWCQFHGILSTVDYEIEWGNLLELSDLEKLDKSVKMADTNSKQFTSGGVVPFSGDEIRQAAGFDSFEDMDEEGEAILDEDGNPIPDPNLEE